MVTVETPECRFCEKTTVLDLSLAVVKALNAGAPVQDVLPDMPAPDREVLRSGIHPECWAAAFGVR